MTSPLISTIWCFRAYKLYIFCEEMILATCQCQHIFCCWVEPSLLLSSSTTTHIEWFQSQSMDVGGASDTDSPCTMYNCTSHIIFIGGTLAGNLVLMYQRIYEEWLQPLDIGGAFFFEQPVGCVGGATSFKLMFCVQVAPPSIFLWSFFTGWPMAMSLVWMRTPTNLHTLMNCSACLQYWN